MVCAEHDAHLYEAGRIFRQLALEPEQTDDVAHIVVSGDQSAHGDSVVGGLFPSVITDTAHNCRWHSHL